MAADKPRPLLQNSVVDFVFSSYVFLNKKVPNSIHNPLELITELSLAFQIWGTYNRAVVSFSNLGVLIAHSL